MIKSVGLLMLFIASVMVGIMLTEKLKNKIVILKSIKLLLQQFKRDITYSMPTLSELFSNADIEPILQFTDMISRKLENGYSPEESISKSIDLTPSLSVLSDEEKSFLIQTFSSVGKSDAESQTLLLENAVGRIDYYIETAIENQRKNSKVYMTASVYIGLAVVIILL